MRVRDQYVRKLERHGPVETASGGAEALMRLESGRWHMLFLDRCLPDLDAEELVGIVERRFPGIRVVLVDSDSADADSPPKNMVTWPAAPLAGPPSSSTVPAAPPHPQELADMTLPGMIGDAEPMRIVYRMARLVARRDTTVLITGPTGSGKDLVARAIHQLSPRSNHGFAVLNCAAIPETLVESELFGYARGAFTGAAQTYAGRILAAQGGTLFLDEIGDLPLAAQSKLLRFLEHKEVQRLGSAEVSKADVRVLAATNCDLAAAVRRGRFREDLYFRLSAFPIRLAPLRQRGGDIVKLTAYFLARLGDGRRLTLGEFTAPKLEAHSWPGNVRELEQVLERAAIFAGASASILPEHVIFSLADEVEGLRDDAGSSGE